MEKKVMIRKRPKDNRKSQRHFLRSHIVNDQMEQDLR